MNPHKLSWLLQEIIFLRSTCHFMRLESQRNFLPSPLSLWILAVQTGAWVERLCACKCRPVKCCPIGAAVWLDNYCFHLSSEANCCHYQLSSIKSAIILESLDQFSCGRKSQLKVLSLLKKPFYLVHGFPHRLAGFLPLGTPTRMGLSSTRIECSDEINQGHHFRTFPVLNFVETSHFSTPLCDHLLSLSIK